MSRRGFFIGCAMLAGLLAAGGAAAQDPADGADMPAGSSAPGAAPQAGGGTATAEDAAAGDAAEAGAVTRLPVPRFVSMKAASANVRRGPSLTHRVDWVFRHQGMPLIVTGEYGHWRRVMDRNGLGGWVHYAMLSGTRTVLVETDLVEIRSRADPAAPVRAQAERGVIARLGECDQGWCRISAGGFRGWVPRSALWGVDLAMPQG